MPIGLTSGMAFNGRFVYSIIEFASRQGASAMSLYSASGLTAEEMRKEETSMNSDQYNKVLERIIDETEDLFFGLHFGESMNLSSAGLVAQITQTCETVKQALEYSCEFAQLACSSLPLSLEERKEDFKLNITPDPVWWKQSDLAVRHTVDGTLVFTLNEYHELTRKQRYPIKVHLPFSRPNDTSEYDRLLKCPVLFNQDEIALFFEKEHILEKIVTSDFRLLTILVAHAQERIEAIKSEQEFYDTVKASVASLVKPEFPTIEQVARHLNVSVRSLQRRLSEEGHTFKEIIENLRKEFAFSYLKKPELSIGEIAYLLNYSDASGFIRSFRRWTGQSPKEYRNSL